MDLLPYLHASLILIALSLHTYMYVYVYVYPVCNSISIQIVQKKNTHIYIVHVREVKLSQRIGSVYRCMLCTWLPDLPCVDCYVYILQQERKLLEYVHSLNTLADKWQHNVFTVAVS